MSDYAMNVTHVFLASGRYDRRLALADQFQMDRRIALV